MTLPRAHAAGLTACAALTGLCALLGAGATPASCLLAALAPLAALGGKRPNGPWLSQRAAPLVAIGLAVLAVALRPGGAWGLSDAANATMALLAARLVSAHYPSHDGQALLMMAILVCAATVLTPSGWLAPLLLAFVVALTNTMVTRQLLFDAYMESFRQADAATLGVALRRTDVLSWRTYLAVGSLAVSLIAAGALAFVAFPRTGLHALSFSSADAGAIPEDVSLRGAPRAGGADRPLVRMMGLSRAEFDRGLYLRAGVYDRWREGTFHLGTSYLERTFVPPAARARRYEVRFLSDVLGRAASVGPVYAGELQLAGDDAVPVLDTGENIARALAAQGGRPARLTLAGPLWPTPADVEAPAPRPRWSRGPQASDAAVPAGLDPRIAQLAATLCRAGCTPAFCADAIRDHLARTVTYSLTPSGTGVADPLADFLFDGRRGHCEYFATAFVLLLRLHAVPARVVGGFAVGHWDERASTVVFSGRHAHAWVEWWDPTRGWLQDDATPPEGREVLGRWEQLGERWRRLWEEDVLGYGADEQVAMLVGARAKLRGAGRAAHAAVAAWSPAWERPAVSATAGLLAAALVLAVGLLVRQRRSLHWMPRMQAALQRAVEADAGRSLRPSETLLRAAQQPIGAGTSPPLSELASLVAAYEADRFGAKRTLTRAQRMKLLRRAHRLGAR